MIGSPFSGIEHVGFGIGFIMQTGYKESRHKTKQNKPRNESDPGQ
jgi:hypothetical protein